MKRLKNKCGLLCDALKSIAEILQIAIYQTELKYEELNEIVLDYDIGTSVLWLDLRHRIIFFVRQFLLEKDTQPPSR